MNDIFVYNALVTRVTEKYKKYFTVNKHYRMKYIISSEAEYIFSDKKEWMSSNINDAVYYNVEYIPIKKFFKAKNSAILEKIIKYSDNTNLRFIPSYDNKYFFYDQKIYEIKKYLIPV